MNDDISEGKLVKYFLITVAILVLVALIVGWIYRLNDRPAKTYEEETRTQVYDHSRQYVQGMNRDIARYCEQMRGATNASARKAVAALIRSNVSTYEGVLTDDNKDCVSEANGER